MTTTTPAACFTVVLPDARVLAIYSGRDPTWPELIEHSERGELVVSPDLLEALAMVARVFPGARAEVAGHD